MVNVTFAHKSHPIEPLGVSYLSSSIAKGGHRAGIVLTTRDIDESTAMVNEHIRRYDSRVFAQSIIFGSHLYAAELNKRVAAENPGLITVLGGPAATFTPGLIHKGWDVVCRYEGEQPFLEFLNALESGRDVGNIDNLWVRENPSKYHTERKSFKLVIDPENPAYKDNRGFDNTKGIFVNPVRKLLEGEKLDSVPHPDREILYAHGIYRDGPIKHFMHTRGCAFRCAYCFNVMQNLEMTTQAGPHNKSTPVRRRFHEDVVKEILDVKAKYPMSLVYFQDDVLGFTYRLEDVVEFADIYSREVGLPFHGHTRFDLIAKSPEIAEHLARAGCTGLHVAIEAGNERVRDKIHRRDMTTKQVREGATALKANGIRIMTQNILGAPTEGWREMMETFELNKDVGPTFASASIFQPYPGTKALEIARDTGALPVSALEDLTDQFGMETFYTTSILAMNPEEKRRLEVLQKFFAIGVDERWSEERLEKEMRPFLNGHNKDEELSAMYREHRAKKDDELYGVNLTEVVGADEV